MNLKKAKALRLLVRQLQANGVVTGAPVRYVEQKHPPRQVFTGKMDENGNPIVINVPRETRHLDPMSPRGVYRRLKKHGVQAVLGGQA